MQMMNFNTQKLLAVSFWGTLLLCTSVPQVAAAPYWSTVVENMPADQKVKGKVVNDKGEPLPGVSIAGGTLWLTDILLRMNDFGGTGTEMLKFFIQGFIVYLVLGVDMRS